MNKPTFYIENSQDDVSKSDDLQGAKMQRRIARMVRRRPDMLDKHPEWEKHKDADVRMEERAEQTRERHREEKPGIVHEDLEQDDGSEKSLNKGADGHVASVAVVHENHILMGKRRDNGRWTLPGGHLDEGEAPHAGGVRELNEEAGIQADKLTHLNSSTIKTHTGKEKTIHAFKYEVSERPPTSMSKDPDQEVERWQWIQHKDGKLPSYVKENLHSPKNAVLDAMGLNKSRFVVSNDLFKSRPHKYIRRYRGKNGEYVYIYHEGDQHGTISHEDVEAHKHLAQHGDESERAHHAELVERIQHMKDDDVDHHRLLAEHGDEDERKHHGSILEHLGHGKKKDDLAKLKQTVTAVERQDQVDKELDLEPRLKAVEAVKAEVMRVKQYLAQHASSPIAQRFDGKYAEMTEKVQNARTVRDLITAVHKIAVGFEKLQGDLRSSNSDASNAGSYGNMIYNKALEALVRERAIPQEYADEHKREAGARSHEVKPMAGVAERAARRRAEEAERERRELGELAGSMAFHMASMMEGTVRDKVAKAREIDQTVRAIFGKSLTKEEWPYHFPGSGLTTKIRSVSTHGSEMTLDMQVYDADGEPIMESWERRWSKKEGRPYIYNAYMRVKDSKRGSAKVGDLINRGQRELMKSLPRGGRVGVTAALDVGGYNWANQGFSFQNARDLDAMKTNFKLFCQQKGINLTTADLAHFTEPVHFAAFTDGKKYEKNVHEYKLTPDQIRTKSLTGVEGENTISPEELRSKTSRRMMCHLGKAFLLGRSWSGEWDSKEPTSAAKFADEYRQMRERAVKVLEEGYQNTIRETKAGQRGGSPARTEERPRVQSTNPSNADNSMMDHRIRSWTPRGGGSIRLTAQRMGRLRSASNEQLAHFLRNASITRTARAQIIELMRTRG